MAHQVVQVSFESGALQISVDVGDDPAALDALLTHVVQVRISASVSCGLSPPGGAGLTPRPGRLAYMRRRCSAFRDE